MTKTEIKREAIEQAHDEANTAKDRLISIQYDLEAAGAIRQAQTLGTIIGKLEAWQHS